MARVGVNPKSLQYLMGHADMERLDEKVPEFVHDDVVYCIYYEVVDILFHIGSELPAKECIIVQFK